MSQIDYILCIENVSKCLQDAHVKLLRLLVSPKPQAVVMHLRCSLNIKRTRLLETKQIMNLKLVLKTYKNTHS